MRLEPVDVRATSGLQTVAGIVDYSSSALHVDITRNRVLVEGNFLNGGCGGGPDGGTATGISAAGDVRIQNNIVSGGSCAFPNGALTSRGVSIEPSEGGLVDLHSNWIDGGTASAGLCIGAGITLAGVGNAAIRNNIVRPDNRADERWPISDVATSAPFSACRHSGHALPRWGALTSLREPHSLRVRRSSSALAGAAPPPVLSKMQ